MSLKPSGEMYLESIYVLCKSMPNVRSIDVAEHMNFSKPSVSRGVGLLKTEGLISIDENGFISLTEKGSSIAEKIYERHTILTGFLVSLGVSPQTASEDACKMEHDISDTSFNAINAYLEKCDNK